MDIRNNDNRILGGFRPRSAIALIFALGLMLGALALAFSEVTVFSTVALISLATLTFMTARDILPICGLMLPCLLVLVGTNNVALPAAYFGFVFAFGASLYLCLGRRPAAVIASAAAAYGVAAFVLDPVSAVAVLIPIALGMLAALMLRSFSLTQTVGILSALVISAGISVFLLTGGDLAVQAESLRTEIYEALSSLPSDMIKIEDSLADSLAAYTVNILPGSIFASVSAVIYIACSLALAFLRSSAVLDRLPEDRRTFSLSPVSGVIFILCFMLSAAFAIEGEDYEMAGAVVENILIALSLPFILFGCRASREFFEKRLFRSLPNRQKISGAAVAVIFLMIPGAALGIFMSAGAIYSLSPIFRAVINKMKKTAEK